MSPFASSKAGLVVDAVAQRYGIRPSQLLEGSPLSLFLDIYIASAGIQAESSDKLSDRIGLKRMKWPSEKIRELRRSGLWR